MNVKTRCKLRSKLLRAAQRRHELMPGRTIETSLLNCSEKVAKAIILHPDNNRVYKKYTQHDFSGLVEELLPETENLFMKIIRDKE